MLNNRGNIMKKINKTMKKYTAAYDYAMFFFLFKGINNNKHKISNNIKKENGEVPSV